MNKELNMQASQQVFTGKLENSVDPDQLAS